MSNSIESIIIFSIHFLSHLLQTLSRFERPMQAAITQVPGYFWVGCLSVTLTSQHPLIDKTFEWVDRKTMPWEFTSIFEHGPACGPMRTDFLKGYMYMIQNLLSSSLLVHKSFDSRSCVGSVLWIIRDGAIVIWWEPIF
jgi:hypothetical protein